MEKNNTFTRKQLATIKDSLAYCANITRTHLAPNGRELRAGNFLYATVGGGLAELVNLEPAPEALTFKMIGEFATRMRANGPRQYGGLYVRRNSASLVVQASMLDVQNPDRTRLRYDTTVVVPGPDDELQLYRAHGQAKMFDGGGRRPNAMTGDATNYQFGLANRDFLERFGDIPVVATAVKNI